jgi:alpha-tubulin suppressor-like RCC1 family protein
MVVVLGIAAAIGAGVFAIRGYVRDFANAASESNGCPDRKVEDAPPPPLRRGSPIPGGGARSVSIGGNRSCAVLNDGTVRCWGNDGPDARQLALAPFEVVLGASLKNAEELSSPSENFGCARLAGSVRCWEVDAAGAAREFAGPSNRDFVALFTGIESACARRQNGEVWCWGRGEPFSNTGQRFEPVHLPALDGADELTLSSQEVCVRRKGQLWCLPKIRFDTLGRADASMTAKAEPSPPARAAVASVANGDEAYSDRRQICTRDRDRGWVCVARSEAPRRRARDPHDWRQSAAPEVIPAAAGATAVVVQRFALCFQSADGTASCYGRTGSGALSAPVTIENARRIAVGNDHACATTTDRELFCWGANESGQALAEPRVLSVARPTKVMTGVIAVAVGLRHTCVVSSDSRVRCFGETSAKQLSGLDGTPTELVAGYNQTCALTDAGKVACWDRTAATARAVAGIDGARSLAASGYQTCALLRDARVSCWTDTDPRPRLVAGSEDSVELAVGDEHACVRTRAGGIRCWGNNAFGQLGRDLPPERQESSGPRVCPHITYTFVEQSSEPGDVSW